jgi:hypothetical protein
MLDWKQVEPSYQLHGIDAHIVDPPPHPTALHACGLPHSGTMLGPVLLDVHPDRPTSNTNINDAKSNLRLYESYKSLSSDST